MARLLEVFTKKIVVMWKILMFDNFRQERFMLRHLTAVK